MAVTAEQKLFIFGNTKKVPFPVASGETIYMGAVGVVKDSDGYLYNHTSGITSGVCKIGIVADERAEELLAPTATTANGSLTGNAMKVSPVAGDKTVRWLYMDGYVIVTMSGLAQSNIGDTVYATDNFTFATSGSIIFGEIVGVLSATLAIVDIRSDANDSISGYVPTSYLDTDGTLAANSDSKIATQKAAKTYSDTKIASSYLDTDGTMAANSDTKIASQKASKTYADTKVAASYLDTDGTLAANSDTKVATQKATKTYADTKVAASYLDTDNTLAANSDTKIATQKATKGYVDTTVSGYEPALGFTAEDVSNKSTDGTMADNSDTKYPSQKASKTYADTKIAASYLDTDGALTANSDSKIATQKATKTYADALTTGPAKLDVLASDIAVPFVIVHEVLAGAASILIFDADAPFDFEIIDVVIQPRGNSSNGTMKITDGTHDITNAMTCAVNQTIARAGTIEDAYSTISTSGSLEIVCAGDTPADTVGLVTIYAVKK